MKDITLDEAHKGLKIDKYSLDDMCLKHSELLEAVWRQGSKAQGAFDTAKLKMEKIDAEIGARLRSIASSEGKKISDKKLEMLINMEEEHIKIANTVIECKFQVNMWKGLEKAYTTRSSMLKYLWEMYQNNYYIGDSIQNSLKNKERIKNDLVEDGRERLAKKRKPRRIK